ncbi:MAG: hypothetical protein U0163_08285 [Gemmatimonadaceae bacterium]
MSQRPLLLLPLRGVGATDFYVVAILAPLTAPCLTPDAIPTARTPRRNRVCALHDVWAISWNCPANVLMFSSRPLSCSPAELTT